VRGTWHRRGITRWVAALAGAASIAFAATVGVPARPAGASPLDDLRAKVAAAQQAADAATARYTDAENQLGAIDTEIATIQGQIKASRSEMAGLKAIARRRAVSAYVDRGTEAETAIFLDGDPLAAARRQMFLDRANAADDAAIARLDDLAHQLDAQSRDLVSRETDQRAVVAKLQTDQHTLETQLQAAQQAQTAYEQQLAQLAAAQAAAERARAAAAKQQQEQRAVQRAPVGGYVAPGIICPVRGAVSFVDSWGAPRGDTGPHQGVDMMASRGTPDVAVVSGTVVQKGGAISGNGVRLYGDDGNLYYYFHLDAYEGGPGHVTQGQVVGYVGNTGDAAGGPTHTHFEVHPGGGAAVDPYPSVASVC
jgi:murein DD-endopeptidase MepM/ murein hydrolase activator NlpD